LKSKIDDITQGIVNLKEEIDELQPKSHIPEIYEKLSKIIQKYRNSLILHKDSID